VIEMVTHTRLPFQYQEERQGEATSFAGLPLYFELAAVAGVVQAVARHVRVRDDGWEDVPTVLALVLLNLAGGDHVEDIERLDNDPGLRRVMMEARLLHLPRGKRRRIREAWRKAEERGKPVDAFPSASSTSRYLARFHHPDTDALRAQCEAAGRKAFVPPETEGLRGLWAVVAEQLDFLAQRERVTTATLDTDATVVETTKREAKFCYKGFRAYQPLNVYWAELAAVVYSEFRDGNVGADFGLLPVLQRALDQLPAGVRHVRLRSDTAGYYWPLLRYCAEGKSERFGRIDFAVGAEVTEALKTEVAKVPSSQWQRLVRHADGVEIETAQEWAEVVYVPNEAARSKRGPDYRFIVTREPMDGELPGLAAASQAQLPFPTLTMADKAGRSARYKVHALVTTLDWDGEQIIWWLRERCGRSEQAHSVMKKDLAGGTMPSGLFGANAAWWAIMVIAFNLDVTMRRLVLGKSWLHRRLKAVRYHIIHVAGRLVRGGRQLLVNVARPALDLLEEARERIQALSLVVQT
jgi:hypothetical protein